MAASASALASFLDMMVLIVAPMAKRLPVAIHPATFPSPKVETAAAVADHEQNQKLWRVLLLVVLWLFALETWLSHRDRKQTAVAAVELKRAA